MNKILKYSFIAVIFIAASCSRYEDGPFLSLKSPEKRLLGLWEITELKVNETDYISAYRDDSVYVKFSIIEYDDLFINIVKDGPSGSQLSSSVLKLEDNKTKMRFELKRFVAYEEYTAPLYALVPPLEFDNSWNILRLISKEFIIEIEDNGIKYKLKFERLEKANIS
jgi:hypothetical protein